MRYLIDTSSLSRAIWDDSFRLRRAVLDLGIEQIVVSVMTIVEIEYGLSRRGIARANTIRAFLAHFDALPFDAVDALEAGVLRSRMETDGRPIGIIDTFIAAQALVRNLTLVTHNAAEFARVGGLRVIEL
jgi:tRNA(fMet)-specific endonuclease VapC